MSVFDAIVGNPPFDSTVPGLSDMDRIMIQLFLSKYSSDADSFNFTLDEVREIARGNSIPLRNPADFTYQYRARRAMPEQVLDLGHWIIVGAGKGQYVMQRIESSPHFEYEIPDAYTSIQDITPTSVVPLLRDDEMSSLTRLRYCEVVSHFTGLDCHEIQTHYRSFVQGIGQVEIDEFYVGKGEAGVFLLPLEAKGNVESDLLGRLQISQMVSTMEQDFPGVQRRILAMKHLGDDDYLMFELTNSSDPNDIEIERISRYRLV